eukprot:gnl/TRDRNA2_/TRDRNA2_176540_c1_seq2.p1 gnl/TRDRNA2_/TRDRNA2_176540_c1~~gnl/TRDRNA2_/TRDRNA2_176540_c1_seq2.p1  ORF type:complete len:104 (-),score=13.26 gnl/TRDRNA2_/TRDRNA2_176540_c1_seq2:103-414(-)
MTFQMCPTYPVLDSRNIKRSGSLGISMQKVRSYRSDGVLIVLHCKLQQNLSSCTPHIPDSMSMAGIGVLTRSPFSASCAKVSTAALLTRLSSSLRHAATAVMA